MLAFSCKPHNVYWKYFIEEVLKVFILFFWGGGGMPHSMQDLPKPGRTRNRTCAPCSGSAEFLTAGPPGKS